MKFHNEISKLRNKSKKPISEIIATLYKSNNNFILLNSFKSSVLYTENFTETIFKNTEDSLKNNNNIYVINENDYNYFSYCKSFSISDIDIKQNLDTSNVEINDEDVIENIKYLEVTIAEKQVIYSSDKSNLISFNIVKK